MRYIEWTRNILHIFTNSRYLNHISSSFLTGLWFILCRSKSIWTFLGVSLFFAKQDERAIFDYLEPQSNSHHTKIVERISFNITGNPCTYNVLFPLIQGLITRTFNPAWLTNLTTKPHYPPPPQPRLGLCHNFSDFL